MTMIRKHLLSISQVKSCCVDKVNMLEIVSFVANAVASDRYTEEHLRRFCKTQNLSEEEIISLNKIILFNRNKIHRC